MPFSRAATCGTITSLTPRMPTCVAASARRRKRVCPTSARSRLRGKGPNDGFSSAVWPSCRSDLINLKGSTMKFLCLIRAEKMMEQMPTTDADALFEEYRRFTEELRNSGHYVGCNRLVPPAAATTVRVRQGKISAIDGPYAET